MAELLFELKGINGQLELYSDKIIIRRKGILSKMTQGLFKGDKTIYLDQITGIQVKPGTSFTNGYIQLTVPGGIESKRGLFDATQDENTVMFKKRDNELVNKIKEKIEELKSAPKAANGQLSAADEIKKYKELLDSGIITAEEFEQKKKQLLGL